MLSNPQPDPRRAERVPGPLFVRLINPGRVPRLEQDGTIIDISPYGARIRSNASFSADEVVDVVLAASGRTRPCRVVWVGAPGSGQEGQAGLEFLNASR
ncbi:MAG TPA: PilZ domain-containing protein [Terriglobia bacterium]|nr:PilZ domain-containing protein [Terriglobia bacterium]